MERKKASEDCLPPNFANLEPELKDAVLEQIYKQQLHNSWGYLEGDPRLTSSDKIKEIYGGQDEK